MHSLAACMGGLISLWSGAGLEDIHCTVRVSCELFEACIAVITGLSYVLLKFLAADGD